MKKIISTILICSLMISQVYGAIVSGNNTSYDKELREQFATKEEVYKWRDEMQFWFDNGARIDLLLLVASISEVHGYISENWNRQQVLDEKERIRPKATDSQIIGGR